MHDVTPQFSGIAIVVLLAAVAIGSVILIRKYPDGLDDDRGLPSFPRMFMVTSACFGSFMAMFLGLVLAGQITFQY